MGIGGLGIGGKGIGGLGGWTGGVFDDFWFLVETFFENEVGPDAGGDDATGDEEQENGLEEVGVIFWGDLCFAGGSWGFGRKGFVEELDIFGFDEDVVGFDAFEEVVGVDLKEIGVLVKEAAGVGGAREVGEVAFFERFEGLSGDAQFVGDILKGKVAGFPCFLEFFADVSPLAHYF